MDVKVPTQISIFIIAKNEGDRLRRTLQSAIDLSNDVVLVDSGSTDDTVSIAESMGARVIYNEWPGYGRQKRFAEDCCQNDWVLNLDADELLSDSLREELRELLASNNPLLLAYFIRIVDVIPGDDRPRPFAHHHDYIRLYNRKSSRFSTSTVHDTVQLASDVICGKLSGTIFHYSVRSIENQIQKFNAYTTAQVVDLFEKNVSIPKFRLFVEFPIAFFKAFVLRRYCMQGLYGFINAMNYAIFRYLRVAKFVERKRSDALLGKQRKTRE